ncbi:hypothetical protein AB0C33_16975 [Nonomuraea sp. NPDC048881]|uniref:hypothetical protein n=1 Tax=Nonomuraea sp. NPDC048881 TaxID=3155030 RepID=UPI0033F592C3
MRDEGLVLLAAWGQFALLLGLFGYERGPGGRAPWLVETLIRRRLKGSRLVAREQLAWEGGSWSEEPGAGLRLNVPADRLAPLAELYEREPGRT